MTGSPPMRSLEEFLRTAAFELDNAELLVERRPHGWFAGFMVYDDPGDLAPRGVNLFSSEGQETRRGALEGLAQAVLLRRELEGS